MVALQTMVDPQLFTNAYHYCQSARHGAPPCRDIMYMGATCHKNPNSYLSILLYSPDRGRLLSNHQCHSTCWNRGDVSPYYVPSGWSDTVCGAVLHVTCNMSPGIVMRKCTVVSLCTATYRWWLGTSNHCFED